MTPQDKDRIIDLYLKFKYEQSAEGRQHSFAREEAARLAFKDFTQDFDGREVHKVINDYEDTRKG